MLKQNIVLLLLLMPVFLFAQKKSKEQYHCQDISGITVDGDLTDWNNTGLYNRESDLWSFGTAINNDIFYAAVIVKDKQLIEEAVRGGIFLNISYSNKKKDGARMLFPRLNLERLEALTKGDDDKVVFSNEEMIESAKGYYVAGFSKVVDGLLSFDNGYGIRAVCKINTDGSLVYEAEIPLNLIKFQTKEIAVELAVNTRYRQMKQMSGSKDNVRPVGMRGRYPASTALKDPYTESTSIWFSGLIK